MMATAVDRPTVVELLAADGTLITLVQHRDGRLTIHTAAMSAAGGAVGVDVDGTSYPVAD